MNVLSKLIAGLYGLATLFVAIGLAWFLLAKCSYFYGVWHDHGGIAQAIEEFGPQNRYRKGFESTTREQRLILFNKIVSAVHSDGRGLEQIFYTTPKNKLGAPLLHQAEIVHLKDAAKLITFLVRVLAISAFAWGIYTGITLYKEKPFPKIKVQLAGFLVLFSVAALIIGVYGWVNVFNQLHIWVFPDDHQWFFYYQDSLMSTMMWAPHLFTYIGVTWLLLAMVFFALLLIFQYTLNQRLLKRPKT